MTANLSLALVISPNFAPPETVAYELLFIEFGLALLLAVECLKRHNIGGFVCDDANSDAIMTFVTDPQALGCKPYWVRVWAFRIIALQ